MRKKFLNSKISPKLICLQRYLWPSNFFPHLFSHLGKILLFYLVFYAGLAGFFAGLLAVFWQTLDLERPKWQLAESIIGTNPGLGFRPMPPEAHLGSTLIWYKSNRPDNMIYWHDTINKFLEGKSSSLFFGTVARIHFVNREKNMFLLYRVKQITLTQRILKMSMKAVPMDGQLMMVNSVHSKSNHWTIARQERQTKNTVSNSRNRAST